MKKFLFLIIFASGLIFLNVDSVEAVTCCFNTNCITCPYNYSCGLICSWGMCAPTCLAPSCTPNCAGKQCGPDGCGGICGGCGINYACVGGQCISTCTSNCAGKQCGGDGCGNQCGYCPSGYACSSGQCVPPCTPNCSGKVCGSDGCNGSCGSCTAQFTCLNEDIQIYYNGSCYPDGSGCAIDPLYNVNCNDSDGWYSTGDCSEAYKDYYCEGNGCTFDVTETRYKTDGTTCSNGICIGGVCTMQGPLHAFLQTDPSSLSGYTCMWSGWFGEDAICPAYTVTQDGQTCCYGNAIPSTDTWCPDFPSYDSTKPLCNDACIGEDILYGNSTIICKDGGWYCNRTAEDCRSLDGAINIGDPYAGCNENGQPCTCQRKRAVEGYCDTETASCSTRLGAEYTECINCSDPCDDFDDCGGLPHHYKDYYCNLGFCEYKTYCSEECEAECTEAQIKINPDCSIQFCISASCTWGFPGEPGECIEGSTQSCGNCGTQTCSNLCEWGPCENQGVCSPGSTQGCNYCGTQTCNETCAWGDCLFAGECFSGDLQCCTDNKTKTCSDCSWGSCTCLVGYCGAECSSSANCDDSNPDTLDVCESNCICSHIDINEPPEKPTSGHEGNDPTLYPPGESWQHCLFANLSLPTFHWTYSDPDGDPQQAYQLRIDDNSGFPAAVQSGEFYKEALSSSHAFVPTPSEWRDWVDWSKSYWWIVRVQDDHGKWSEWSDPNRFNTPTHAYPYPDFAFTPADPVQGETVSFNPDDSESYGETTISNYLWDITQGSGTFASSTESSQYPEIIFTAFDNAVALEITDSDGYSCQSDSKSVITEIPLPEYHESSPGAWLKKLLDSTSSSLAGLFYTIFNR